MPSKNTDRPRSRDEVRLLARDMLIAGIAGVGVPSGDDIREVVRGARTFYDEIDHPTKRKAAKVKRVDEGEVGEEFAEGAETELEEEL